ncbi:ADP-ribosylglycohydrolase family protein [Kutzneria sp. NPDC051319]|uniref:ADP-ribosylglycohydrolase family protein n=1 Tax=Kutzneria sp. NPDC051319 TaxID=3155047 RepID=UPI003426309C
MHDSLRGLAFGEQWILLPSSEVDDALAARRVAGGTWPWTDDTAMTRVLVTHLHAHGAVVEQARRQASVTHAHSQAVAGAIAVVDVVGVVRT